MTDNPGILWSVLFFALAISPLIFVHELGHYFTGRLFGVKADVFSIGFGRALGGWTDRRGTRWQIGWLPMGGYVRFAGDMGASSQTDPGWTALPEDERNRTFPSKPVWQRALIVLAGPVTNFLFAIAAFSIFISSVGEPRQPPVIAGFAAGSSAEAAGMRPGDRIISIGAQPVQNFEDVALIAQINAGKPLDFVVQRGDRRVALTVAPRLTKVREIGGAEQRIGQIGVAGQTQYVKLAPSEIPAAALRFTAGSVRIMVTALGQIVTGQRSVRQLGGPVKMAAMSGEVATAGPMNFLLFMAMISINLGFINLLPIPMLDGGHLALYAVEAVRRRPVEARAQEWAFRTGLVALLAFMLVVTVNDLAGLGLWSRLAGLIG